MPLSTNAPFNEFGQSMIMRDIEQLYLLQQNAGTGNAGDGQTQAAAEPMTQETAGGPTGGGVTTADLAAVEAQIPSLPLSIANGGTAARTAATARTNLGLGTDATGTNLSALTNAATARGNLALGTMAVVNSPVPIANGGTAAASILAAISNLSLRFGTRTIYTSGSGSHVAPYTGLGLFIAIGGGGGGSNGVPYSGSSLGFVATSSGGSPTQQLFLYQWASSGGAGAIVVAVVAMIAGENIAYSVGAGGSVNGSGGDSTVSLPSSGSQEGCDISAGGGRVLFGGNPGVSITSSGGTARTPSVQMAIGPQGRDAGYMAWVSDPAIGVTSSASYSLFGQTSKGRGGNGRTTSGANESAGTAGLVIICTA